MTQNITNNTNINNEISNFNDVSVPQTKINQAKNEIDFSNPTLSISYGANTMGEISKFTDSLLINVKIKDSGPVGNSLADLMSKLKTVDIGSISNPKKNFLLSIPVIGKLFGSISRTVAQFDTVLGQIESISSKLEEAMFSLLKDIEILEQMYGHNKNFYQDLTAHIEAGEEKLKLAREKDLVELEKKAQESNDNLDAQNVRDFADKLNRFEKRLHDLKLSRTITLQTAPQIRMIQSNNQTLAEKIQTSILSTIPIWKNQMILALSIHSQQKAVQMQRDVANTTNDLLKQNAEMLQSSTIETAREVERGIVDINSLQEVHEKLLKTIEETINIAQKGREYRDEAEKEIQNLEKNLRDQLTDLANKKKQDSLNAASKTDA